MKLHPLRAGTNLHYIHRRPVQNTKQNPVKQNSKVMKRLSIERELFLGEEQHCCPIRTVFTWAIPQCL